MPVLHEVELWESGLNAQAIDGEKERVDLHGC